MPAHIAYSAIACAIFYDTSVFSRILPSKEPERKERSEISKCEEEKQNGQRSADEREKDWNQGSKVQEEVLHFEIALFSFGSYI